jgi:YD repeat-containing protein
MEIIVAGLTSVESVKFASNSPSSFQGAFTFAAAARRIRGAAWKRITRSSWRFSRGRSICSLSDQARTSGIYQAVYNYDSNGNVILRYVGNWWRITDLGQRDALDRPTHIQHQLPGGTCTLDYQYNAISSLTSVQRESGTPPDSYGYDQAQQLTSTALSGASTGFGYDANGNRTSMNGGGTYTPNGLNQFSTLNGQGVSYDANGNLASYNGWTYSYDKSVRCFASVAGNQEERNATRRRPRQRIQRRQTLLSSAL